ncbi:hypothetical protein B0H15DRAFT_951977 [Mycena belliarum]|uniref:Uncharacterized protein n=1 Tax=Mycena belliarum TaxID=1033014 RepID=A0AAD6U262_9AGAR|nr:hypothetical protein B0H15DRAFT_951977 [Mycena belliae]
MARAPRSQTLNVKLRKMDDLDREKTRDDEQAERTGGTAQAREGCVEPRHPRWLCAYIIHAQPLPPSAATPPLPSTHRVPPHPRCSRRDSSRASRIVPSATSLPYLFVRAHRHLLTKPCSGGSHRSGPPRRPTRSNRPSSRTPRALGLTPFPPRGPGALPPHRTGSGRTSPPRPPCPPTRPPPQRLSPFSTLCASCPPRRPRPPARHASAAYPLAPPRRARLERIIPQRRLLEGID